MSDPASHGPLRRTATLLFEGWGYNQYRRENQLRADDLLVRSRVSDLLAAARAGLSALESAFRRAHLPPPTRANPYPDAGAVAQAQALARAGAEIGAIEGRIRAAPAPERDEIWRRHRNEAQTLAALGDLDTQMVALVLELQDRLDAADATAAADPAFPDAVLGALRPLAGKVEERANFLRLHFA